MEPGFVGFVLPITNKDFGVQVVKQIMTDGSKRLEQAALEDNLQGYEYDLSFLEEDLVRYEGFLERLVAICSRWKDRST